jgi:hypothetical protein
MPERPACVENWNSDSRPEGMKNTTHDLEEVQEIIKHYHEKLEIDKARFGKMYVE